MAISSSSNGRPGTPTGVGHDFGEDDVEGKLVAVEPGEHRTVRARRVERARGGGQLHDFSWSVVQVERGWTNRGWTREGWTREGWTRRRNVSGPPAGTNMQFTHTTTARDGVELVGVDTVGGRLHLMVRYRLQQFDRTDADAFADLLIQQTHPTGV